MQLLPLSHLPSIPQVSRIQRLGDILAKHALYSRIRTLDHVRRYMEHQVWCVWDFMCLLKSIQSRLLSSDVAWTPPRDSRAGHLVYELLLSEETDIDETGGGRSSHFETFLRAMSQAGCDRGPIDRFIRALGESGSVEFALAEAKPPRAAARFVETTLEICKRPLHATVAAFCYSREGIIPEMFTTLLANLCKSEGLGVFEWYLRRHVSIDTEYHGPQSIRLFDQVVGRRQDLIESGLDAAIIALEARQALLDSIVKTLERADIKDG